MNAMGLAAALLISCWICLKAARIFRLSKSIIWTVGSIIVPVFLLTSLSWWFLGIKSEWAFALTYASTLSTLLCGLTFIKANWLVTRGVIEIPDGQPNDPDNILRAFPIVGPLPVVPRGTPWNWGFNREIVETAAKNSKDTFLPWAPDPPLPKTGKWKDPSTSDQMRWQPTSYSETLKRRILRGCAWSLSGPVCFTAGVELLLNSLKYPLYSLQGPAAAVLLLMTSGLQFRFLLRRTSLFSQLIVDSPAILADSKHVRNPAKISAIIETLALMCGYALVAFLFLYCLQTFPTSYRSRNFAGPSFWSQCAALYSGVFVLSVALQVTWKAIRPIGQGRLYPLNVPEATNCTPAVLRVAHLSDLHLTGADSATMLDGKPSPNGTWQKLISNLRANAPPDLIIITGDQTNAGQEAEWKYFFDTVGGLPSEFRERMILIPGNHDLNLAASNQLGASDSDQSTMWYVRALRCLAAIDIVQGERAWVIADGATRTQDKVVCLRDFLDPVRSELSAFMACPPTRLQKRQIKYIPGAGVGVKWIDVTPDSDSRRLRLPVDLWPRSFPMVIEEPKTGVLIYVIDSNAIGGNIMNNAFGTLRWDSAILLRRLQRHFGKRPSLFLLHHHLALPPNSLCFKYAKLEDALFRRFMILSNPSDLVAALPHDRETIVFHGHRHVSYLGRLGNLQIVSAPSSTLGDESDKPGLRGARGAGYSVFGIDITPDGATVLRDEQWIPS